jgi:hypothetical protein
LRKTDGGVNGQVFPGSLFLSTPTALNPSAQCCPDGIGATLG